MTIEGTDFCIQQKGVARKGNLFGSHKYAAKSVHRYKLGVDILAGNLVWVEGPYPTGAWNHIKFLTALSGAGRTRRGRQGLRGARQYD
jgi:hypothetical protein